MLSHCNADIAHRDVLLPGLATLLDSEAFLQVLQRIAPELGGSSATLRYLRYKPGENCLAAFSVETGVGPIHVHAKAIRSADRSKLTKAVERVRGGGRFVLPAQALEVCRFPYDNKLPALAWFMDAEWRSGFLPRHLRGLSKLGSTTVQTLAYKPERRWVGSVAADGVPFAICKLYGKTAFDHVCGKAAHLNNGDLLRLAPQIGQARYRRARFFGWKQGSLLSQAWLEPSFESHTLTNVGKALAELHCQPAKVLPRVTRDSESEAVRQLGRFLAFILPESAERFMAVSQHLAERLRALPESDATIHGDFYAKQVLLHDNHAVVLDLDEAGRGDPLADVANFLAHLERESIVGRLPATRRDEFHSVFLDSYRSAQTYIDLSHLDLLVAAKLFSRMPHFFRHNEPAWPIRTTQTLAKVDELLQTPRTVRFRPLPGILLDPSLPGLNPALDPQQAGPLIDAALRQGNPRLAKVEVRSAVLLRHKEGRRALVEYQLAFKQQDGTKGTLACLGKLRARGVNRRNLELLSRLHAGGFASDSADGISIPRPLGVVTELGMWLQPKIQAPPLAILLTGEKSGEAGRRAAQCICKLHRAALPVRRAHCIANELSILDARLSELAMSRPAWKERLGALFRACSRLAGQIPATCARPIHRDFYHDQLLLDNGRIWLTDLDLLCAGDPALDAGNFAGHLIEWGTRDPESRHALQIAREAFLAQFLELTHGTTEAVVEIYTTLTLARHVAVSSQFADRAPFTESILELCEARCDRAPIVYAATPH